MSVIRFVEEKCHVHRSYSHVHGTRNSEFYQHYVVVVNIVVDSPVHIKFGIVNSSTLESI